MAEFVNGYELLAPLKAESGGRGVWTFAKKGKGADTVFIKKLDQPACPPAGSPAQRKAKQTEVAAFIKNAKRKYAAIHEACARSAHICPHVEIFEFNGAVYVVSKKFDRYDWATDALREIPFKERLAVAVHLAEALSAMHGVDLVHGDIKHDNVLMVKAASKTLEGILIDYDDSYFAKEVPKPENLILDFSYASPEVLSYMSGGKTAVPSKSSDIFSLGLYLVVLFTGKFVRIDKTKKETAARLVAAGKPLTWDRGAIQPAALNDMIEACFKLDPHHRPAASAVHERLKDAVAFHEKSEIERMRETRKVRWNPSLFGELVTTKLLKKLRKPEAPPPAPRRARLIDVTTLRADRMPLMSRHDTEKAQGLDPKKMDALRPTSTEKGRKARYKR